MKGFDLLLAMLLMLPLAAQDGAREYTPKSSGTGIGLAVVNTVLPVALGGSMIHRETNGALAGVLFLYGGLLGPSIGNFYAKDEKRALYGIVIRSAALVASLAVMQGGTWDENGSRREEYVLLGALLVSAGSAIWNIATVPRSVRAYEQRHRFSLHPTIHSRSGNPAISLQLRY